MLVWPAVALARRRLDAGHATRKLVVDMAAPATEHVRNIVLVGQDGAGKTSLAEAMLHVSGRTPRMGTTHDGKSYLDYDQEEIRRRFTIGTSIAPIPYKDFKINLLDTSGHPDFIGDTLASMNAAEMALFVVDAVAGPQVMTTKLWREAEGMRLSRAVSTESLPISSFHSSSFTAPFFLVLGLYELDFSLNSRSHQYFFTVFIVIVR